MRSRCVSRSPVTKIMLVRCNAVQRARSCGKRVPLDAMRFDGLARVEENSSARTQCDSTGAPGRRSRRRADRAAEHRAARRRPTGAGSRRARAQRSGGRRPQAFDGGSIRAYAWARAPVRRGPPAAARLSRGGGRGRRGLAGQVEEIAQGALADVLVFRRTRSRSASATGARAPPLTRLEEEELRVRPSSRRAAPPSRAPACCIPCAMAGAVV